MKKAVILAICAVMLGKSSAYAVSNWAAGEAESANRAGLVTESLLWGSVTENITREEFCYLAMNLYKNMGGKLVPKKENPFSDTKNSAVLEAYSLGIINGKTPTLFCPKEPITRQEIAKIIMLTVNELSTVQVNERKVYEICRFADFEQVGNWAVEYMESAHQHRIITGVSETLLAPEGNATREQAVVIMNRAYEGFSNEKKEYEIPKIIKKEQTENELSLSWERVEGASGYTIILRDRDKNVIKIEKTQENTIKIPLSGLSFGNYSAVIGARIEENTFIYSPEATFRREPEEYVEKYPTYNHKVNRVFPGGQPFTDYETAKENMKTVTVPVWNLDGNGKKYSSRLTVEVNANLAEDIVKIFTEIYNSGEQFPIKNIGGFSWRNTALGGVSEHSYGTCIDINWDENYYCHANGQAITGSFWKPYENPYSIPKDGVVVRTFKKYGFLWGGDAWQKLRDYMHFTYLGR